MLRQKVVKELCKVGFHLVHPVGCLSLFLPKGFLLLECSREGKGPPQTGNPVFAMAWAVCPHSVAAARAVWEMHSDLDQHS